MRNRIWVPAAFMFEDGIVFLNEPTEVDTHDLITKLIERKYVKPFVFDNGVMRRLYFRVPHIQSEMAIRAPGVLTLAYTQAMTGFMLFAPAPRHILIVGLGGGSHTKYCYHRLPSAHITTVEINPAVIAFGDLFEVPPQNARHTLVQCDAIDYIAGMTDRADVILLDGCDGEGIAPGFCDEGFYRRVHARLDAGGVVAMNLAGPIVDRRAHVRILARVFGPRLIVHPVRDGNQVVFAFENPTYSPEWPVIEGIAAWLTKRHGLDYMSLARGLQNTQRGPRGTLW
jgi:spermidine synthase